MTHFKLILIAAVLMIPAVAFATIFGSVRGIVHDPQHRPVQGAQVTLKAQNSDWTRSQNSSGSGDFEFGSVPIGTYIVTVSSKGFQETQQQVTVQSDTSPVVHFELPIAGEKQTVLVSETPVQVSTQSVTPTTMLNREDIRETPGADRTNGMEMITDYVPAAYVTHDMLHMRGGHQVEWLIDGVPVPNTNIANNLGPQIDPKDIDYLEVQRGSYDADYGDRTYGIFNIVPRTGFERYRECDLVISAGNFYQTNDQLSCGGHTQRFAYYSSLNGYRSDYGLQTPIGQVVNDASNGFGGFASFIFNPDPKNQYRVVTSLRRDYFQIPIDPDPNSSGNYILVQSGEPPSFGLHDAEREPDGYVTFSWVHTFNPNTLITASPFYHYNGADYIGGANDFPVTSNVTQTANYVGGQIAVNSNVWKNDVQAGVYGFYQHQYNYFSQVGSTYEGVDYPTIEPSSIGVNGGVAAEFINDKFKVTSWLTLMAGVRVTEFRSGAPTSAVTGSVSETDADPRFGVAIRVPRLNWVFRGFYGYYYQAPPLSTATSPLENLQFGSFAPLHGERDREWQYGVVIPVRGWILDADTYQTKANNWLDHNNIGASNIFWPITWDYALIQGWELTLRSPRLWQRGQFHLAYANQIAQATSPITGGLVFSIPPGLGPVDHDQRNTLNFGYNTSLPWHSYASTNIYYGSGFTNGEYQTQFETLPGQYSTQYLPAHTTFDLALGKEFEKYSVSVTGVNVTNRRVQLDNSLTFGGFHWNDPRQIYGEFRWRFHY